MKNARTAWSVLLAVVLTFGPGWNGAARGMESYPVVFACLWDESGDSTAWLLGAFREGAWIGMAEAPLLADGKEIAPEDVMALGEPVVCVTPLLEKGNVLAFYAPQGRRIGDAAVRETRYSRSAASGEVFVDVALDGVVFPPGVPCVGIAPGRAVPALPTSRGTDGKSFSFTASGATPFSARFVPTGDGQDETVFLGTVVGGGKSWTLGEVYLDPQNPPEGFFIDMNGDGRPEFLLCSNGVAAFIAVWDLKNEGAEEVLTMDLGD